MADRSRVCIELLRSEIVPLSSPIFVMLPHDSLLLLAFLIENNLWVIRRPLDLPPARRSERAYVPFRVRPLVVCVY